MVSFSEIIDPNAVYDFSEVTIFPIETMQNVEDNIVLTYEHAPHTVIHDIDRSAPFSAELSSNLFDNIIGTGEQFLQGLVFDQSWVTEVKLQSDLGETVTCTDTVQVDAFSSDWVCAIHVPDTTPDGRVVTVELLATDVYGFNSGVIAQWQLTVDNTAPQVSLLNETGLVAAQLNATSAATETLILEGMAGDDRLLAAVEVCDALQGFESCHEAELYAPTEELSSMLVSTAGAAPLTDEAYWFFETAIDAGIDTVSVPYTVTAYDAFGNATAQTLHIEIDTKAPTIVLDAPPVTQIAFDEAFGLSGNVQDKGHFSHMELEVQTPLGEVEYYPVTLQSPANAYSLWFYELPFGSEEFAMPGKYSYTILAYDAMGNESELGPYTLEVDAPPAPMLNTPFFVTTTNDLWAGFAPGAPLYMQVYFDDADLEWGDAITITTQPIPAWLTLNRLDERTFEITGTVPLTISELAIGNVLTGTEQLTETSTLSGSNLIPLNVGVLLEDKQWATGIPKLELRSCPASTRQNLLTPDFKKVSRRRK